MLGPGRVGVKAALALALGALAGCHTRGDTARAAATHVELMVAMAAKGSDLLANGRFTAESLPELTYPLERADAFARALEARGAPPPWLSAFRVVLARYRDVLDTLDRIRREQRGEGARAAMAPSLEALRTAAASVLSLLGPGVTLPPSG
jgi:hypothetical protein